MSWSEIQFCFYLRSSRGDFERWWNELWPFKTSLDRQVRIAKAKRTNDVVQQTYGLSLSSSDWSEREKWGRDWRDKYKRSLGGCKCIWVILKVVAPIKFLMLTFTSSSFWWLIQRSCKFRENLQLIHIFGKS